MTNLAPVFIALGPRGIEAAFTVAFGIIVVGSMLAVIWMATRKE